MDDGTEMNLDVRDSGGFPEETDKTEISGMVPSVGRFQNDDVTSQYTGPFTQQPQHTGDVVILKRVVRKVELLCLHGGWRAWECDMAS